MIDRCVRAREADAAGELGLLHKVAAALLERETLTRDDIEMLSRGDALAAENAGWNAIEPNRAGDDAGARAAASNPPLLGGPEPSPA